MAARLPDEARLRRTGPVEWLDVASGPGPSIDPTIDPTALAELEALDDTTDIELDTAGSWFVDDCGCSYRRTGAAAHAVGRPNGGRKSGPHARRLAKSHIGAQPTHGASGSGAPAARRAPGRCREIHSRMSGRHHEV